MNRCIYKKAIASFGANGQLSMVKEELAELIVAISHYQRNRSTKYKLTEEIADVYIMIEQLKLITSITDIQIEQVKGYKLSRLENRLKDSEIKDL